jgi:hypothetical protein
MRARRIEVLTAAVAKTGELVANLKSIEEPSEAQKKRLYNLMLNRGRMLTETARSQEDPTFSFEQSNETLEELVFLAGENSPFGLRAFAAMGDNMVAQGRSLDAAYSYEFVVNTAIPKDLAEWEQLKKDLELDQPAKEVRWLFLELATRGLVKAYANEGDPDSALSWAMHFYNTGQSRREPRRYRLLLQEGGPPRPNLQSPRSEGLVFRPPPCPGIQSLLL